MSLTLDAAFWRRVYADRQRLEDEREWTIRSGRRQSTGTAAVRAVPLSHAAAMRSARAELAALAHTVENLNSAVYP